MKKNILFVLDSLKLGGAEKSLVTLLSKFDFDKYSVDLLLLYKRGDFLKDIPLNVNIIELAYPEKNYFQSKKKALIDLIKNKQYEFVLAKLMIPILAKIYRNKSTYAQIVWKKVSEDISLIKKQYDVAIAYSQGLPTYLVIEKVSAKKKITYCHNDYRRTKGLSYENFYLEQYDYIVAVSQKAREILQGVFPYYANKIKVVYNMILPESIIELARSGETYKDDFNGVKILSIGRLHFQKGYDIALAAIKRLVEDGINIRWYIIGEGNERNSLEKIIEKYSLKDRCILLGGKENPYAYLRDCNIYLQSSRSEGYCIALGEARVFKKPIVSTDFAGAREQLNDGETGIITQCNCESLYNSLKDLLDDYRLQATLSRNLSETEIGNLNEIDKLYNLIEN